MVMLVAVIGPVDPLAAGGVPVTVMQEPETTAAEVAACVWVKTVDDVHPTVTWPVCGFWTSMEVAVMVATVPNALGVVGRVETPADGSLVEACALVEVLAGEPQAAANNIRAPSAAMLQAAITAPTFGRGSPTGTADREVSPGTRSRALSGTRARTALLQPRNTISAYASSVHGGVSVSPRWSGLVWSGGLTIGWCRRRSRPIYRLLARAPPEAEARTRPGRTTRARCARPPSACHPSLVSQGVNRREARSSACRVHTKPHPYGNCRDYGDGR